jgi:hypothetical protein
LSRVVVTLATKVDAKPFDGRLLHGWSDGDISYVIGTIAGLVSLGSRMVTASYGKEK